METAIEIIETEKPYTLRKLNAGDIVPMCAVIKNIGWKEIKDCFGMEKVEAIIKALKENKEEEGESNVDIETVGFEVVMDVVNIILNNLDRCMDSIFNLLSRVSGMTTEEVAALDLAVFAEMIVDVVKEAGFKDFIKVVFRFLK